MKVHTSFYEAIAFVALAFVATTPAQAAEPVKEECRAGYQKLCPSVQPVELRSPGSKA
ncbi:hypothetical protein [Pseudomonas sp. NA-150]|uniref:hypothetical protein n=1 Tax=Pseudomonas sp. NA-150 TaxID=3367525 RepID=UPI0037C8CA7C